MHELFNLQKIVQPPIFLFKKNDHKNLHYTQVCTEYVCMLEQNYSFFKPISKTRFRYLYIDLFNYFVTYEAAL